METDPVSMITMRASGVVSIAFAKTGLVSLCTSFSEMFPPSHYDLIEMLKDDLADLAPQTRPTVVLILLKNIETLRLQPILAREPLHRDRPGSGILLVL
jgi:hypothetical protein